MKTPSRHSASPSEQRAVVMDEWALFRQGVAGVLRGLDIEVVGEAAGASEALMQLWSARPTVLVAGSPAFTRLLSLIIQAKKLYPDMLILALLPASEAGAGRAMLSSGADAVLTREATPEELEQAIRKVLAGERVLAAAALSVLVGEVRRSDGPESLLTTKELEVLSLVAKGLRNAEIAAKLVVSVATVKSHRRNIYRKLDVSDRQGAVRRGIELGQLA